jgi:hypothetical protein
LGSCNRWKQQTQHDQHRGIIFLDEDAGLFWALAGCDNMWNVTTWNGVPKKGSNLSRVWNLSSVWNIGILYEMEFQHVPILLHHSSVTECHIFLPGKISSSFMEATNGCTVHVITLLSLYKLYLDIPGYHPFCRNMMSFTGRFTPEFSIFLHLCLVFLGILLRYSRWLTILRPLLAP